MRKPRICAVIVGNDAKAVKEVEADVDLFEVRIDLIGESWPEIAGQIRKPWIATNRCAEQGGQWQGNEGRRIEQLLQAMEMGASIIDIELDTKNLDNIVKLVKRRAQCLLSHHDLQRTPPLGEMRELVQRQLKAGADVCKVVTTAQGLDDNLAVLELDSEFPGVRLVSFAMGPLGALSRVLCPLVGADFTYASIEPGGESAPGQITARDLLRIYEMMRE